ncbi:MAG: SctF chaperone SctG [Chlamydiae bacterium]|nr:SctF chaperone SctG [Chlamydiota bacterium]
MAQLQKYKDNFLLLVEAGFIATNMADEDTASKLFKASALLSPENSLPKIGVGYMHLLKLELKQASKVFEDVLSKDPTDDMARTFLGLSLALSPTDIAKGEKYLAESAAKSKDPIVKNLAVNALDFVEKFVKKGPTPEQMKPMKKEPKKKK